MRTQAICLALAIVLLCPFASAQWVQTNGPYGGRVSALAVSGTNLFAGTESAGVFRSTNNGKSWTAVNSGLTNKNVVSLAATSNGIGEPNIFAGTSGGGVFRSSDNGTNWTEVNSGLTGMHVSCLTTSPNEKGGTDLFACIGDGYVGGSCNIVLSTNNGTSWNQINTEVMHQAIADAAVIGTGLFVAASFGGGLLRFTNNGTRWALDTLLTSISVYSLAVSGDSLFAGTSDGVFLFADNDTSWTQVNSGLPSNTCVYTLAVSGTNLFANTGLGGVYLSTNSGLSWSPANSGLSPNGWPYISAFASIGTNIFAGTWDGVFLSTDNGTNWTPVNTRIACTYVYAFAVVPHGRNPSHLFVSADRGVYLSTDNGIEWTLINKFTDYGVFCFLVVPNDTGGINILGGGNGVFLSTDNGISWTSKGLTNTRVFSFSAIGSNLFAGTEDHGVFLSTNNGASWTSKGLTNTRVLSFSAIGSNLFAGTDGGVFLSTNNGANWTPVNNGLPEEYGNYFIGDLAASGSNLFVGTGNGGVFLSTNDGTNWTAVNTGLTNAYVDALAVSGGNLFAGTSGGVFLSTNNGTSWTEVNSGLPSHMFITEVAISGNDLVAGTGGNGVWRRPLSEMITAVRSPSELPTSFTLDQNYPNPFNPSTTIRYGLPNRSHVILMVFNTVGQQVATLVRGEEEAGYHVVRFDASGLSSGVYFYRLQAGTYGETRKLLLVR